jgi:predicted oxidoreductase (fatty acid repression mutant protein)
MYLHSINDQVWDLTESDYAIIDPNNLTNQDKANKQCNTMALNTIYNAIDSKVFEKIKDYDRAYKL